MIYDLRSDDATGLPAADVCIVGAGAAGIALAVDLARQHKRVVLLEAGGRTHDPASQNNLGGNALATPHRGLHEGRAQQLGGTTTLWGGQILELDHMDFEPRPWVPGSGWPITKKTLQPFYERALEVEGVSGALQADEAVWSKLHTPQPRFDGLETYFSRWCPEPDFSKLHRRALEGDGIEVWLHATACRLQMSGQEVTGVCVRSATGRQAIFRARSFVFCLGAIESSRFFLQALDGQLPWNQSGRLGKHFQDHIDSNAATLRPRDARGFHRIFDTVFLRGRKYAPKLRATAALQQREALLNVGATVFSTGPADDDLLQVKATAKLLLRGQLGRVRPAQAVQLVRNGPLLARHGFRYARHHRAFHDPRSTLHLRVHCEQQPQSASSIGLGHSRDAAGLLRTDLSWKIDPSEIQTVRRFVQQIQHTLKDLCEVTPNPALLRPDDSFLQHCQDSFHHMGGMRMDPSPRCGVVDNQLKLHGTSNCYICSTAVFPTSGFSNPTHTLLALTMRLSTHLQSSN